MFLNFISKIVHFPLYILYLMASKKLLLRRCREIRSVFVSCEEDSVSEKSPKIRALIGMPCLFCGNIELNSITNLIRCIRWIFWNGTEHRFFFYQENRCYTRHFKRVGWNESLKTVLVVMTTDCSPDLVLLCSALFVLRECTQALYRERKRERDAIAYRGHFHGVHMNGNILA